MNCLVFLSKMPKFRYVFLVILTVSLLISQYVLFITRNHTIAPQTTQNNNTIDNTSMITTITTTTEIDSIITADTTAQTPKQFLVLLWTPYFGEYRRWPTMENMDCKYRNCKLTQDRRLFDVSDALVFHWTHLDIKNNDLPAYHNPKQMWILLAQESPNYSPLNTILPLNGQINWTMTFRRDSHIFAPYGEIVKCNNSGRKVNEFSKKVKNVAWIVSNCKTHSKREQYVKELQKYIDVEIYGGCGKYCSRQPSCLESIARDYKFYLSFENSICKDYVTEKLFNAAQYDFIPVVRGGGNYSAIMPPNSYIDAFNFFSPKHLAEYLHVVGSDPIKYNSYMSWKQNYCSVYTGWNLFCNMCDRLNNPLYSSEPTNLTDWWFRGGNCSVDVHE